MPKVNDESEKNKKQHKAINTKLKKTQELIKTHDSKIKNIESRLDGKKINNTIKHGKYDLCLKKAVIKPKYASKTVLTDSTWSYVEIYLKSEKDYEAITYWNQAKNFYEATEKLSMISKPLTTYYCMLNATKALLTHKKVRFDLKHGVSGGKIKGHNRLQNEEITIFPKGVLSGLCSYLKENVKPVHPQKAPATRTAEATQEGAQEVATAAVPEANTAIAQVNTEVEVPKKIVEKGETYSLKDILYNLEYIHRAYCLTYPNQAELFIPIEEPRFVYIREMKQGWFEAKLERMYSNPEILNRLPGYSLDKRSENIDKYTIRRNKKFKWDVKNNRPSDDSFIDFDRYYYNIRKDLRYIYSPEKLWYIKRKDIENNIINRNPLTLTYAAMHRLSELSRYDPEALQKHLDGKESWLLTEFITKSIQQFIDAVSSEITGNDFRGTGFRT